ncbi:photosynthetic complex putative assembly protein PuhB [Granulosicoccus sp.]|nr:photosynthetic complex putative assembly protein PuhB [Granulosicoccus sp.]
MHDHDDFDFEDSPGIPAPLPPGEHVLWQGSPDFLEIAKNAFHIRKIAMYFALILGIQAVSVFQSGSSALEASLPLTIMLSALGLGILVLMAWLTSRVTIYTVTNRRVLIRFGIALQMTMNLPFSQISAADMRKGKDGFGDIPLSVKDSKRVSYVVLWPNVRPWAFSKPQPMLRSIPNVSHVAGIIANVANSLPVHTRIEKAAPKAPSRSGSGASADAVLMKPEVS